MSYIYTSLNPVPNAQVCLCIWQYILQNYNYKLRFQNLFIYDIPHVSIGALAAENLDVCTACDPWNSNIHLTMGIDRDHGNRLETTNIPQRWEQQ
jgi:hypothetical protein